MLINGYLYVNNILYGTAIYDMYASKYRMKGGLIFKKTFQSLFSSIINFLYIWKR